MTKKIVSPEIVRADEDGEVVTDNPLEEQDVAFDPSRQHLDLTPVQKRRTTALMLAIQAYKNLLIPDAAYLKEASDLARRGEGPKIQPATIDAMVVSAIKFDHFIAEGGQFYIEEKTVEGEPSGKPAPMGE